jgi:hypothetical protein
MGHRNDFHTSNMGETVKGWIIVIKLFFFATDKRNKLDRLLLARVSI